MIIYYTLVIFYVHSFYIHRLGVEVAIPFIVTSGLPGKVIGLTSVSTMKDDLSDDGILMSNSSDSPGSCCPLSLMKYSLYIYFLN